MIASEQPSPNISIKPDPKSKLRATIGDDLTAWYAVIDGGQFYDLPNLTEKRRIFARSLFLDSAHPQAGCRIMTASAGSSYTRTMAVLASRHSNRFSCGAVPNRRAHDNDWKRD